VRTPLAGWVTGAGVVIALYALTGSFHFFLAYLLPSFPLFFLLIFVVLGLTPKQTDAFYWIPNAALSAVIIHAVLDLIASPAQSYGFWKASPLEAIIFAAAVIVSIFATIEAGIYTSVAASLALLLIRIARPRGAFLGRVRLRPDLAPPSADGAADPKTAYDLPTRDVYLPLLPSGVTNPLVQVEPPPPGVIVFRFVRSPQASRKQH
jgi:sodium-independent sulfate anion transporter 11